MKHLNGNKSKKVTPTKQSTKEAIKNELQNAQPTLKTSDYYTLYLGHKYKMPNQRTFMTLDFWIDFIGQEEAEKHLKNMQQTNNAFTIFSVCQDAKTNQK
tara:strand:+ start:137 stop:436 length:300 start_codon:yes stop_codon:yes gene_type:complete